jgi:phosphoglucomutase
MTRKPDERAGKPVTADMLVDVPRLITSYFSDQPDPAIAAQRVSFGTSGHRGSVHPILSTEPYLGYHASHLPLSKERETTGPLFIERHTRAFRRHWRRRPTPNGVTAMVDASDGYTPTPVISHAIFAEPRAKTDC